MAMVQENPDDENISGTGVSDGEGTPQTGKLPDIATGVKSGVVHFTGQRLVDTTGQFLTPLIEILGANGEVVVVSETGTHTIENSDVVKVVSPDGLEEGKPATVLWMVADGVTNGEIEKREHTGRAVARIITGLLPQQFEEELETTQAINYQHNKPLTPNDLITPENFIEWLEQNTNDSPEILFLRHIRSNLENFLKPGIVWDDIAKQFFSYRGYSPQEMAANIFKEGYEQDPVYIFLVAFYKIIKKGAKDFYEEFIKLIEEGNIILGATTLTLILETPTEFIIISIGDSRSAAFSMKGEIIARTEDTVTEYRNQDGKKVVDVHYLGYQIGPSNKETITVNYPKKIDIQRISKEEYEELLLASYTDGLSFQSGHDIVAEVIREYRRKTIPELIPIILEKAKVYVQKSKSNPDDQSAAMRQWRKQKQAA